MIKKMLKILYFFIVILIILVKECYGYLDPSAMTYMIQIGAAVIITISTSIGIIFYKIKRKLFNKKKEQETAVDNNIEINDILNEENFEKKEKHHI